MRLLLSAQVGFSLLLATAVTGKPIQDDEASVVGVVEPRMLGGYSSKSKSKGKGKGKGKGGSKKSSKPKTIYEVIEFETDDGVCGSLDHVKEDLEGAFLAFFEDEEECEGSNRRVESLNLIELEEAPSCNDSESEDSETEESKSKESESKTSGKGKGKGSKSKGSKSKGKGKGKGTSKSKGSKSRRELGEDRQLRIRRRKKTKGKFNAVTCTDCDRRRLEEILANNSLRTLAGSKGKGKGKGYSSKSKGKGKGKGQPKCGNLAKELREFGFEDVEEARVTDISKINCSSKSKDCRSTKSTRGACCGVDGCACNTPSESLCEANDCCIEQARNFEPDFCEDFCDTSECGAGDYSGHNSTLV
eukprot:CAMPEP_0183301364 /NCGR_PEP_ID=MMETSP0160_2-20130417/7506_1 /TAXON_ID=2839 ORGANISM="Odontella Sinensis, Strain Grunow 1884" /NCGR_SAMPLE_ID=MMETSP0160_2 /ASSEMBLY_ACC=CAM_ASM_000250 /LENGTH=359 /DNA_ID=CAMNT_0025463967 /DNA_START=280 /DNA_END=1359 /DNA_ORIENTATION=+